MNDRFRFRAWDKKNKRMLYNIQGAYDGTCIEDKDGEDVEDCCVSCFDSFIPEEWQGEDYQYIVEQSTGLKDKNGKLIYEGDIVLSNIDYGGTYFVIVGDVRGYCYDAVAVQEYKQYFANGKETGSGLSSTAYHIITDHGPCEVIGNIHENHELLEADNGGTN